MACGSFFVVTGDVQIMQVKNIRKKQPLPKNKGRLFLFIFCNLQKMGGDKETDKRGLHTNSYTNG